ncbi:hypothetical protein PY254_04915 [Rhodanobacter sp. AS-Z3]|uniref:hypothetical protein n=1 Tax=Rhodanobacter sp. AS-Z3 TaxID=3031330 RepID=UPI0024786025|nr:hypothetical protein [Rhodanobacter sp. AS-Z3]WEN16018.1 hypothetical protein PY254_04915 [Rhodanobacter sp. AS-Z3]
MFKFAAWVLFAWGAFVFIALPVHRYDWMQQMDPSIAPPPTTSADNSSIFVLLLLAAIVLSQVALIATASSRGEKIFAIALAVVAMALWMSRFWR